MSTVYRDRAPPSDSFSFARLAPERLALLFSTGAQDVPCLRL